MLFIQCINEKITYILGFIIRKAFFLGLISFFLEIYQN
jgi:hypothetical protein